MHLKSQFLLLAIPKVFEMKLVSNSEVNSTQLLCNTYTDAYTTHLVSVGPTQACQIVHL